MTAIPPENYLLHSIQEQLIRAQFIRAQQVGHRSLLVVSGTEAWCQRIQASILALVPQKQAWNVCDHCEDETHPNFPAAKIGQRLGQECDVLIWGGFSGIDPDALAAAAGLIRAGGLLLVLVPPQSKLLARKDPDYLRMCSDHAELSACSSHFLQRLYQALSQAEGSILLTETAWPNPGWACTTPITASTNFKPALPTADQLSAIEAIIALHTASAPAVLLLSAQRGRGKSSALGIACARMLGSGANIILSAASKQNAAIALLHFEREYTRLHGQPPTPDLLVFHAPDTLLQTRPNCDLLLIDEAAMLPVPMLIQLGQLYPKCVFATTTDGYEGSGQGFLLKFRTALTRQACSWQQIELKQPIRWADDDPLEQAINSALLLNHSSLHQTLPPEALNLTDITLDWLDQAQLATDEPLLQQLVGLLTEAHYQTRPSDLRMLLDHPRIRIAVIRQGQYLLATAVLIAEGNIFDPGLAKGLIAGTRRPRGHLMPQALTQFSGDARWLELTSWRVMRIAVQPEFSRQKLGSHLLTAARQQAEAEGLDYLATSFGLTGALLPFWLNNQYQLLRIGYHRDAASACHSAHMILALSPQATSLAQEVQHRFAFLYERLRTSHFNALDTELAAQVQQNLSGKGAIGLNPKLLPCLSDGYRLVEDTLPELRALLEQEEVKTELAQLSDVERILLDLRINHGLGWQDCSRTLNLGGKKVAERLFRQLIGNLLKY